MVETSTSSGLQHLWDQNYYEVLAIRAVIIRIRKDVQNNVSTLTKNESIQIISNVVKGEHTHIYDHIWRYYDVTTLQSSKQKIRNSWCTMLPRWALAFARPTQGVGPTFHEGFYSSQCQHANQNYSFWSDSASACNPYEAQLQEVTKSNSDPHAERDLNNLFLLQGSI